MCGVSQMRLAALLSSEDSAIALVLARVSPSVGEVGFSDYLLQKLVCLRRLFFFFQAEDGIRDLTVTGVQTCALPISLTRGRCPATRTRSAPWHRGPRESPGRRASRRRPDRRGPRVTPSRASSPFRGRPPADRATWPWCAWCPHCRQAGAAATPGPRRPAG